MQEIQEFIVLNFETSFDLNNDENKKPFFKITFSKDINLEKIGDFIKIDPVIEGSFYQKSKKNELFFKPTNDFNNACLYKINILNEFKLDENSKKEFSFKTNMIKLLDCYPNENNKILKTNFSIIMMKFNQKIDFNSFSKNYSEFSKNYMNNKTKIKLKKGDDYLDFFNYFEPIFFDEVKNIYGAVCACVGIRSQHQVSASHMAAFRN